jgi:hypothetical protein
MTKLTPDQIDRCIRDYFGFAKWVYERSADSPQHEDLFKHALIAIAFNEDSYAHWRRLATWALSELSPPNNLTPEEQRMRDIAQRIYDSEMRVAARFKINLYPPHSEDALQRALDQLTPFVKQETKQ